MTKDDDKAGAIAAVVLLGALGIPMLIGLGFLVNGYVLSALWGWFMVPALHLPPLSVPYAIGVCLVAGFLTNHRNGKEAERDVPWWQPMLMVVLKPGLALLFGWTVKAFI
jgi:hypothetical protein